MREAREAEVEAQRKAAADSLLADAAGESDADNAVGNDLQMVDGVLKMHKLKLGSVWWSAFDLTVKEPSCKCKNPPVNVVDLSHL